MIGNIKPLGQGHMRPVSRRAGFQMQVGQSPKPVYSLPDIFHCFSMWDAKKYCLVQLFIVAGQSSSRTLSHADRKSLNVLSNGNKKIRHFSACQRISGPCFPLRCVLMPHAFDSQVCPGILLSIKCIAVCTQAQRIDWLVLPGQLQDVIRCKNELTSELSCKLCGVLGLT